MKKHTILRFWVSTNVNSNLVKITAKRPRKWIRKEHDDNFGPCYQEPRLFAPVCRKLLKGIPLPEHGSKTVTSILVTSGDET